MPTTVAPCRTRIAAAVSGTPSRRLTSGTSPAPSAETSQAADPAGPMIAAAASSPPTTSDSRTGSRASKVTMPKPQNSSTPINASRMRERRSSPAPAAMTDGTSRTDLASEP